MATKAPAQTYSAKALSVLISRTIGRTVSPKQVRGRVRGDAGSPLLARFGPDVKGDYASHVYSADEADLIGQAFVEAHNKRSATSVSWRAVGPKAARKSATRKPRKAAQTVHKAAQTDEATDAQS